VIFISRATNEMNENRTRTVLAVSVMMRAVFVGGKNATGDR